MDSSERSTEFLRWNRSCHSYLYHVRFHHVPGPLRIVRLWLEIEVVASCFRIMFLVQGGMMCWKKYDIDRSVIWDWFVKEIRRMLKVIKGDSKEVTVPESESNDKWLQIGAYFVAILNPSTRKILNRSNVQTFKLTNFKIFKFQILYFKAETKHFSNNYQKRIVPLIPYFISSNQRTISTKYLLHSTQS